MGILGFLNERETGSFKAQRYRQCHKSVREWLERLSASPVLNQPCEFSGEPKATFLVDFSPDRTKIASAHGDHTVRVTEISTGKCTHILTGHPRTPWCLAFHPSHDDILASGCLGGQVRIWDLRGGGSEVFHSDSNSLIASLTFHPIDRVLVFSTKNMLYFWNWTQQEPFTCCTTTFEYERVRWVKFDRLGHYLYTGICNNTTVTRPPMYDIVNRNDRQSGGVSHPNWQQRQSNRQRYERLVSQIRDDQQQRLRDSTASERPRSPVHEDRLRQAYDYARYVTSHSRDNYSWIQLSRRRAARRGGAVDVDESANRPAARYSMFSWGSHVPQPGANSPPPRPLPDSNRSESDHDTQDSTHDADQHRNLGTDQQDVETEDTDSQAVGSGRTGNPRITLLNRLIGLEARRRASLTPCSLTATSTTVAAGQGSSQASASSSSASEGGRIQTSQEANNNSERMDVDYSADSDRDAQTSVPNPGDALVRERSVRSTNPPTFQQRLSLLFGDGGPESRANPPPSTHISTGASSVPPSASAGRTLGQGEGSGAWGEIAARTEASSSVGTGASPMERTLYSTLSRTEASRSVGTGESTTQRGTLYSALSRLSSISNSAFSVPSSRSGSASSSLQSVQSSTSSLRQGRDGSVSVSVTSSGVTSVSDSVDQLSSRTDRPASGTENFAWLTTAVSSSASTGPSSQGTTGRSALSTSSDPPNLSTSLSSSSVEANSSGASSANNTVSSASAAKRSYCAAFTPSSLPLETTQTLATTTPTSPSLLWLRNRDSTQGQAGSSSIQVQSGSSSSSQESASGASISWRSRLLPWEQGSSSSSSLASRSLVSTDFLEGGEYTPGSVSCRYLHTQLTAAPMEQPNLRASIITDINRVRRLAYNALSWSCDFDRHAPGSDRYATGPRGRVSASSRCPVCRNPSSSRSLNPTGVDRILPLPTAGSPLGFYPRQRLPEQNCLRIPSLGGELTSDGTSQTQGQLNEPEHADRGTDMAGLGQQEGGGYVGDHTAAGEDGAQHGSETGEGRLQRVESDLERQLSENDDEISRIENSYLEEMERLASERQRILSTLRGRREPREPGSSVSSCQANTPLQTTAVTSPSNSDSSHAVLGAGSGSSRLGAPPSLSEVSQTDTNTSVETGSGTQTSAASVCSADQGVAIAHSAHSPQTTSALRTALCTGGISTSSSVQQTVSLSTAVIETSHNSPATSRSDSVAVTVSDSSHNSHATSRSDSVAVTVSDSSHNSHATSRSDSVAVTVSDSSHNSHATSRADPVAVTFSDSSHNSHATSRADPVAVTVSDSSHNSHATSRSDSVAVTVSDSSHNSHATSSSSSSSSAFQHATSRADPVAVTVSDSSHNSHATSRSDPVAVIVSDSSQGVSSSDGSATTSRQQTDIANLGPFHTLPAATGSDSDRIEVLTGSGESETISFSELARRLANRDDVMVVGNHRMAPASTPDVTVTTVMLTPSAVTPATVSSGEQRSGHLLRSCLVSSSTSATHPAPVPPPLPRPSLSTPISSSATAGRPVPPLILVQQPASEDQPAASGQNNAGSSRTRGSGDADWYGLEQRHLHPHYSRSILDDTINRPTDTMQSAINRAIAGVFMSSGEQAVASNIVPGTHRVQRWDFTQCHMPDLTHTKANVVVEHCKIHNDASIDISRDSSLLATFVNNHGGFPDDNILAVFSLRSESFGQCLYTKSFGPNAISVSLSPSNQYVMVGLASKRMMWIQVTDQLVGQTFKLNKAGAGEYSMMHVTDLYHPVRRPTPLVRGMSPVSVNSARWLPDVGEGIVYGTNHGDLHFYRAGRTKAGVEEEEAKPRKLTISTQTGTGSIRRSAFTQTIEDDQ
ncbi:pneumococcal serine-rich repeat protein-like [Littorina saxatilis]|uniref:Activating molecule in BECN1-regulated autophagy protein 1 n=1 Tax=Littorina saxatilis TaxID=31220 RepID=A0AAN9BKD1_9CAEN